MNTAGQDIRTRLAVLLCMLPAVPPLRVAFEASMAMLMLGLLPALFVAGCLAPGLMMRRCRVRASRTLRPYALALLAGASLAYGVWMLPVAIDLSRMFWPLAVARDLSAFLAGLASIAAVRVAPWPLVLFFGGNMVWMGLTIGMLFIDAQTRLCANYLLGDQRAAGVGVAVYALGLAVWLLAWAARRAEGAGPASRRKARPA